MIVCINICTCTGLDHTRVNTPVWPATRRGPGVSLRLPISASQQHETLTQCRLNVDGGPTLNLYWINVSCLLGVDSIETTAVSERYRLKFTRPYEYSVPQTKLYPTPPLPPPPHTHPHTPVIQLS